jgi:transposase
MSTVPHDLRERILDAYDRGGKTRQEIADHYEVSLGMVKKLLQQRRRTGDIAARNRFSGAKPKITIVHQRQLGRLVTEHPEMTLSELRDALGVSCTCQAIHYALGRMGLSLRRRRSVLPGKIIRVSGPRERS